MDQALTIPGYIIGGVVAVGTIVGATIAFQRWLDGRFVTRDELDPKTLCKQSECDLRHRQVDAAINARADRHHELANEMNAVKLALAKIDKRLAVFMAAIAKDRGMDFPSDE